MRGSIQHSDPDTVLCSWAPLHQAFEIGFYEPFAVSFLGGGRGLAFFLALYKKVNTLTQLNMKVQTSGQRV